MATKPTPENNLPTGIVRTPRGFRAFVRVAPGPGGLKSKCFKPGTSLLTMRRWREEQRVRKHLGADLPETGHTLREDVAAYLRQVQTMPTIRHRRDDLALWLKVLGPDRPRHAITSGDIRAQLEQWRADGYAASTVNHRRTALMHLWSVLDGKSAPNPARDVPRYHEDSQDAPPRALSQTAADLIMACMGPSLTRARLELYRWTGWDQATMAQLTPADIRWDDAVNVPTRKKGRGVVRQWLPLLPQGWAALREYKRLGAWGAFSTASARTRFRRAARKARRQVATAYAKRTMDRAAARRLRAELLDVTPKQLRHTFGTLVAAVTQDDRAVQALLQHADLRQTHRYTGATVDPRVAAALAKVQQIIGADAKP